MPIILLLHSNVESSIYYKKTKILIFNGLKGTFGKPYHEEFYGDYNVSHDGNNIIIVYTVSDSIKLGVDLIYLYRRSIDINNYKTHLTTSEFEYIGYNPDSKLSFYLIWGIKEAYTKMLGRGIGQEYLFFMFIMYIKSFYYLKN